jgi:hypothetical protein
MEALPSSAEQLPDTFPPRIRFRSSLRSGRGGNTALADLKRFNWSLTADKQVRECGHKFPAAKSGGARAVLDITIRCSRKWVCPTCGDFEADIRSRELGRRMVGWSRSGHGRAAVLLTLTQAHHYGDQLDCLWDRLNQGWNALTRGSGWRRDKNVYGIAGYVWVTEVVHHPHNGWNVHRHVVLLLTRRLDDNALLALRASLAARYIRGIAAKGGHALREQQDLVRVEVGSEIKLARYLFKGTQVRHFRNGSRTPMAILADLKSGVPDHYLWRDFCDVVSDGKRRTQTISSAHIDSICGIATY